MRPTRLHGFDVRRLLVVIVGILSTWLAILTPAMASATASTNPEVTHAYVYVYDIHRDNAVPTWTTTERGLPSSYHLITPFDAAGRWWHGSPACCPDGTSALTTTCTSTTLAAKASTTPTTCWRARVNDGALSTLARSEVAAKTEPSKATRPVGSVLGQVDDVMANRRLPEGVHPAQLERVMRGTPGWEFGVLGRGRSAGSGWTARELNSGGTDFTGRSMQWSPGSPRHFGGAP